MDWLPAHDGYAPAEERHREARATLGNGYFATRGATTEAGRETEAALARTADFKALQDHHERCCNQLWDTCDMTFDRHGSNSEQVRLRVHIVHLPQTVSPNSIDDDVAVSACRRAAGTARAIAAISTA